MNTRIEYCLYDSRYLNDPDDAICYLAGCETLKEARKEKRESFTDAVIVKTKITEIKKGVWQSGPGDSEIVN